MRQIASRLFLTIHWALIVLGGLVAFLYSTEYARHPAPEFLLAMPAAFLPVAALWAVRAWWLWLTDDSTTRAAPRPPPAQNWTPPEQEEAGPNTSAWVEEKLRAAKRPRA